MTAFDPVTTLADLDALDGEAPDTIEAKLLVRAWVALERARQ
jgi:hypothetical protein